MQADLFPEPSAPYAISSTPEATACSKAGAQHAASRIEPQCQKLLDLYRQQGPLTDRRAAELMGIERTTVNARRAQLVKDGKVIFYDAVPGTCGVRNTRWGCA